MNSVGSATARILAAAIVIVTIQACGTRPTTPQPPEPGKAGLEVTVNGLPAGLDAQVTVTFEGAVVAEVAETVTLPSLAPGDYTVAADEVADGAGVYVPDPPHAVVRLEADEVGASHVEYRLQDPTLGSIALVITGLPSDAGALVDVVAPGGVRVSVEASSTLRDLTPGEYLIEALPVAPDSATFTPSTATQSIMVAAGDVSDAAVGYACSTVKPPDFHLERAIRDSLNITTGEITCSDLATLTTLYASGYGIADPTLDGLQYAPVLTHLYLDDNLLTELDPDALAALTELETLYLSNNQLSDIAAGTFAGQGALKELALDRNSFVALPQGSFAGLDGLTTLVLDGNALSVVPDQVFADVPLLETLRLRATGLTEVTSDLFAGLPELRYLDLGANDISSVAPDAFSGLVHLQHLDLAYNELTELPSGWAADLAGLDFLTLRENRLTEVATGMFTGAENLTWLDLMSNELTEVPDDAFRGLPLLTDLLLRDNMLTDLTSHTFDGLPALRILSLTENLLTRLANDWFSDLPALAVLYLEENCLAYTSPRCPSLVCSTSSPCPACRPPTTPARINRAEASVLPRPGSMRVRRAGPLLPPP